MTAQARSGAALILAVVILTALLLLGLPFAMSQNRSVDGAYAFRAGQAAEQGVESAESLGLGASAEAIAYDDPDGIGPRTAGGYWTGSDSSALDRGLQAVLDPDLSDDLSPVFWTPSEPATTIVRLRNIGRAAIGDDALYNQTDAEENPEDRIDVRMSLAIEDDGGRLDVNDLGPGEWDTLLNAVGIEDWDDDNVVDSHDLIADPPGDAYPTGSPDGDPDDDGLADINNGDNDDNNNWGELAEALARLRFEVGSAPDWRIDDLSQLLDADPGHNQQDPTGRYAYDRPGSVPSSESFGFRRPLTLAELERLRPYLTTHRRGQGRRGLQDLGTVILADDPTTPGLPDPILDSDASDFVKPGSVLLGAPDPDSDPDGTWRIHTNSGSDWTDVQGLHLGTLAAGTRNPRSLSDDDLILIEQPSPVNLNAATSIVLEMTTGTSSFPVSLALPFTSYGNLDGSPGNPLGLTNLTGAPASGPFANLQYLDLLNPTATGRALPPVAMRSFGVVRIHAGATALDPGGRPVATRRRHTVAQALPQNVDLVLEWKHQGRFEHLRRNRDTSQLASYPIPLGDRELTGSQPDTSTGHLASDLQANLATVRNPPVERGWSRPMRDRPSGAGGSPAVSLGTSVSLLSEGDRSIGPITGAVGDIKPDGIIATDQIEYTLDPTTAPLQAVGSNELFGHQMSLWFKPEASWGSRATLFEVQADPDTLGIPLSGGSSTVENQNLYRIDYDPAGYLVVVLANPAIEHTFPHPHGPMVMVPADDVDDASTMWNEACLSSGSLPLAPAHPAPLHRVEHYYRLDGPVEVGRWYHLQVVISHSRPGGIQILLDQQPGRDVHRELGAISGGGTLRQGDQGTLPALILTTALPGGIPSDGAPIYDESPSQRLRITLERTLLHEARGIPAEDCVAARGAILIGDEVIAYTGISGGGDTVTLENCVRGSAQNTWTTQPAAIARPVIQNHQIGSLVVPYGPRLDDPGTLYTGATELAHDVTSGDPDPASEEPYKVWAEVSADSSLYPIPSHNDGGMPPQVWIDDSTTSITVASTVGTFPPSGGIIVVDDRLAFFYTAFTSNEFSGLTPVPVAGIDNAANSMPATRPSMTGDDQDTAVNLWLASIAVTDDVANGSFPANGPGSAYNLLQITDNAGRIEWLQYDEPYTHSVGGSDRYFFVSRSGWNANDRGRERTIFAAEYNRLTGSSLATTYSNGSNVLPVQTVPGGHRQRVHLHTGDVVTLMPDPSDLQAGLKPQQMAIRFAATDHYVRSGSPTTGSDSHNEMFAFTEAVPAPYEAVAEILVGTGWSGHDLTSTHTYVAPGGSTTTIQPSDIPHQAMPRLDAADGGDPSASPSDPPWTLAEATCAWLPQSGANAIGLDSIRLDALTVGHLGSGGAVAGGTEVGRIIEIDGNPSGSIAADPTAIGQTITTDTAVFAGADGVVLVRLGGEVVAVDRSSDTEGEIVARALFGTAVALHTVNVDGSRVRGPDVLRLPIGPAIRLDADIAATHRGELPLTPPTGMTEAPAYLLLAANGSQAELCYATEHAGQLFTAPWLRGIYGTTARDFVAGDLAIAWWPRFASPITEGDTDERRYRCRRYAWAGFPVRFTDTVFLGGSFETNVNGTSTLSFSGGFLRDGSFRWEPFIKSSGGTVDMRPFMLREPTDGGEMRVWLTCEAVSNDYATAPADWLQSVAERSNTATAIENATLQVTAPMRILGRETSR